MNFIVKFTGILLIGLITSLFSAFHDTSFIRHTDSLFQLADSSQITYLDVYKGRYKYYQLITCKNINQPMQKIVKALQNIPAYKDYFNFMKRSRMLYDSDIMDSVALFEPGVLYYRAYYFGKISAQFDPDSSKCILYCGDADQKKYKNLWADKIGGLIKIGFYEMDIYWTIQRLSDNHTRISLTTSQAPAIWIPQWLMELAAKGIFPGMLRDLDKYLISQI